MFSRNKEKTSLLSHQENGRTEMQLNDRIKSTPLLYMPWSTKLDIYHLFLSQHSCRLYCYCIILIFQRQKPWKYLQNPATSQNTYRTIISHLSICSVSESIKNLFHSNCFSCLAVNCFPDNAVGLQGSRDRWALCWHLHTELRPAWNHNVLNNVLEAEVIEATQKRESWGQEATQLRRQNEGVAVVQPAVEKAPGRL